MNYYIKQFFEVSKDEGVPTAIRLATDFVANTLSRKLITSSPPGNPIPLKDKKILFLEAVGKTDGWGIGDGIFRSPILDWLGSEAELHMLTREARSPVFDNNPNVAGIFTVQEDRNFATMMELIQDLRGEHFDAIVALNPQWRIYLFMYLIKQRTTGIYISRITRNEVKSENLIRLFLDKVRGSLGYQKIDTIPSPVIHTDTVGTQEIGKNFLPGKKYIGVNIGAKSGLRHFREWRKVFQRLKDIHGIDGTTIFVLVGKDGVGSVDEEIIDVLGEENVLNFCNKATLVDTYAIISHCRGGFIGMDGGNVNAAIALRHRTHARVIPIYNAVNPELRIPSDVPLGDCALIPCVEETNCFTRNGATHCTITGQSSRDNAHTPPCLEKENSIDIVYEALVDLVAPLKIPPK